MKGKKNLFVLLLILVATMNIATIGAASQEKAKIVSYETLQDKGAKVLIFHCDVGAAFVQWILRTIGETASLSGGVSKTGYFTVKVAEVKPGDTFVFDLGTKSNPTAYNRMIVKSSDL